MIEALPHWHTRAYFRRSFERLISQCSATEEQTRALAAMADQLLVSKSNEKSNCP